MELRLIADTNLFFECKRLEDLPWDELGADPVVILLTRPVLEEIDKHKKGTGRTRDRALDVFSRVRAMLKTGRVEDVVREASPRVVLRHQAQVSPANDLRDLLGSYDRNDDRLVGILATLSRAEGQPRTLLFTHDTGPAATAAGLGFPTRLIEDHWLRPPAETDEAKKVRELEKKLSAYAAQEPKVVIEHDGDAVVNVVRRVPRGLLEKELHHLMEVLKVRHPMREDFSPPSILGMQIGGAEHGLDEALEPPSEASIQHYREELYPQWLARCWEILSKLHEGAEVTEPPVHLTWRLRNEGSRPATQVLVEFETSGPISLVRPVKDEEEQAADDEEGDVAGLQPPRPNLPPPPPAPTYRRVPRAVAPRNPGVTGFDLSTLRAAGLSRHDLATMVAAKGEMEAFGKVLGTTDFDRALAQLGVGSDVMRLLDEQTRTDLFGYGRGSASSSFAQIIPYEPLIMPRNLVPAEHEPEAFYYDWKRNVPVRRGALTCDLWRHSSPERPFNMEVVFDAEGETGGRVSCTVHAENLTKPANQAISVRRRIEEVSMIDEARRMIAECA